MTDNKKDFAITTKDILKIIPLDDKVRARILDLYPDKLDYDVAMNVEELAWDAYYSVFDAEYKSLINGRILENARQFDMKMHEEVLVEIASKHASEELEVSTSSQLEDVRKKLEDIAKNNT